MAVTFPAAGLGFLRDLGDNNTKEWFQANKKRYEAELKKPARALVEAVNAELETLSPDHVTPAGKAVNRINRDIRFSADKTPYNTRVWAGFHNQRRPKGAGAGYYFGFSLDGFGVGAGCWMPPKDRIQALREHIAENWATLRGILDDPGFASTYGDVGGDKYKRVPKPWDAEHPAAELLKHKGLHLRAEQPVDVVTQERVVAVIADHFRRLKPFVAFLDEGLGRGL